MQKLTPSPQNQAILDAWLDPSVRHLMIDAYAGTGKTTQLKMLAEVMDKGKPLSTLVLAFNKKNAKDLEEVMPPRFTCSTLNSIGHRALGASMPRGLRVDADKVVGCLKAAAEEMGFGNLKGDDFTTPLNLVRWAKVSGLMHTAFRAKGWKELIPDTPDSWQEIAERQWVDLTPDLMQLCRNTLLKSLTLGTQGTIDYDDQIYMSALGPAAYTKYQVVMVDEAQDLSALNHLQLKKSLALGGRLVVVGDPKQAIYAFRGADSDSMGSIVDIWGKPEEFLRLPLSLTYRCPRVVVQRQQKHVPGYEAAATNREGQIIDLRADEWGLDDLPTSRRFAILCRNNAPLLRCAFRIIASGRGVTMLGRDIGKSLNSLIEKISDKKNLPLADLVEAVEKWRDKEISIAEANRKEAQIAAIHDRADCILAVCEFSGLPALDTAGVKKTLLELFEDQSGNIVLGTGHRSKGMEWGTVVHLDPWRIPSKHARDLADEGDDSALQQEFNLRYVIETRTQENLVLANLDKFVP